MLSGKEDMLVVILSQKLSLSLNVYFNGLPLREDLTVNIELKAKYES